MAGTDKCLYGGCERLSEHRGYCGMHYQRLWNSGQLEPMIEIHGMDGTPVYKTWISLKARCYNKNDKDYVRYGGRGITVCARWKHSFNAFYSDMGDKPEDAKTIDRIDNNKGYDPSNCRWVSIAENNRNRSNCKITWNDIAEMRILLCCNTFSYTEIGKIYGIDRRHVGNIARMKAWSYKNKKGRYLR